MASAANQIGSQIPEKKVTGIKNPCLMGKSSDAVTSKILLIIRII
jgi:hypothetical protein